MKEALKRYYLQQLGVDVWETRMPPRIPRIMAAGWDLSWSFSSPEGRLLRGMLQAIGLACQEVIWLAEPTEQEACRYPLPEAVLLLGESPFTGLDQWSQRRNIPVVRIDAPVFLLENTRAKKMAYHALLALLSQLAGPAAPS